MLMTDIIAHKRDKLPLSDEEIKFFISGVTNKSIPDYQISALLMAILLNGMDSSETLTLTNEMAKSGDMLDLSSLTNTVDKHSTGGVGDKTTLIVAPIAAALGCTVAKMSGRGLGHTGGTVDKFEAITGYKTAIDTDTFKRLALENGICIVGQSGNFAPADKRLYALRDVTATVNSIPLIASSIMSKKLAAGAENIVLDVKFGSGAFMKTAEAAEKLANTMVEIGKGAGRRVSAVITDMEIPLGLNIGNALEVKEAIDVLKGKGPKDLTNLSVILAAEMYKLCFNKTKEESLKAVREVLDNGLALKKLITAVKSQGGDEKLITGKHNFPQAEFEKQIVSLFNGYITSMNSEIIGKAATVTGAGRETLDDKIDYSSGVALNKKYGDYVEKGDVIATLYGEKQRVENAEKLFLSAFTFGESKPLERPLVYKIIE